MGLNVDLTGTWTYEKDRLMRPQQILGICVRLDPVKRIRYLYLGPPDVGDDSWKVPNMILNSQDGSGLTAALYRFYNLGPVEPDQTGNFTLFRRQA